MLIAVKSPTEDILRDGQITLKLSRERGGVWATQAEAFLADVLQRCTDAGQALAKADIDLGESRNQLNQAKENARLRTGAFYDELWNALGRVRYDQQLAALFPGGFAKWWSGSLEDRIVGLETLAKQLDTVDHPILSSVRCAAMAVEVRALAAALKAASLVFVRADTHQAECARIYQALGRAVHVQLSLLKKTLLGRRFRQDQIHQVIPDRSPPKVIRKPTQNSSEEGTEPENDVEAATVPESAADPVPDAVPPSSPPQPVPAPAPPDEAPAAVTTTTVTMTTRAA